MANKFAEKMKKRAENPAMMFISSPEEAERRTETPEPEPILRAPQRAEAKSRRLQLLLQPSLYEAVKARAEAEGVSVNEEIGELLRSALRE